MHRACCNLAPAYAVRPLPDDCCCAAGHSLGCLAAVQEAEDAQQEADGLRTSWQCRICLSREVDSCMTACGHVLCSDCTRGVRGRCPFCRKTSSIARLFK